MGRSLVLFDGTCKLCNASVRFITKRDPKAGFCFSPLQSERGEALLKRWGIVGIDGIVLIKGQRVYTHSSAALHIARGLTGAWPLLYGLILIPKVVRDALYKLIAARRYKWFGKEKASCPFDPSRAG